MWGGHSDQAELLERTLSSLPVHGTIGPHMALRLHKTLEGLDKSGQRDAKAGQGRARVSYCHPERADTRQCAFGVVVEKVPDGMECVGCSTHESSAEESIQLRGAGFKFTIERRSCVAAGPDEPDTLFSKDEL